MINLCNFFWLNKIKSLIFPFLKYKKVSFHFIFLVLYNIFSIYMVIKSTNIIDRVHTMIKFGPVGSSPSLLIWFDLIFSFSLFGLEFLVFSFYLEITTWTFYWAKWVGLVIELHFCSVHWHSMTWSNKEGINWDVMEIIVNRIISWCDFL